MTSDAPHVVVAGAGVTGLTCALELVRAGARVTVCDPSPLGDNASGVAGGMLAPAFEAALDDLSRDHFPLLLEARDAWPKLARDLAIDLDRSGAVARGPDAWLDETAAALTAAGAGFERRPGELFTPEDWRLDAPQALSALRTLTEGLGVSFFAEALQAIGQGERIAAFMLSGLIYCDAIVLANGFPGRFNVEEQHRLTPYKGQILRLPPLLPPGPVLRGPGVYLCPSEAGLLLGATMEEGLSDLAVDLAKVQGLRDGGSRLLPEVADAQGDVLVGVRAATPDGLPMVGPSSLPGVILATGMRRNGWLLAPLVARIVAAYALGQDPGPWAKAFDPGRFER